MQQDLNDLAGNNYPAMKRESTGLLDAIVSSENTSGTPEAVAVNPGNGKRKDVIVRWFTPGLESETSDEDVNICTADGISIVPNEALVSIDSFRRSPVMEFTKDELRNYCEGPAEYRANAAASRMSALFRSINKDLIAQYVAQAGGFYGGVAAGKAVNFLAQEGLIIQADPNGEFEMNSDFSNLGVDSRPIVVGNGNIDRYTRLQGIGCCNNYGQAIDQTSQFAFFRDKDIAAVTAEANQFFAFASGANQFLKWNLNKGEFAMVDDRSVESTVVDPVNGIELDYDAYYDRCTKTYKIYFYLNYKLWTMPEGIYQVGDDRAGTNNCFIYDAEMAVPAP